MHGSPRFPIRYLIMNHLWICRNKYGRGHCPILSDHHGADETAESSHVGGSRGIEKASTVYVDKLGSGWTYTQSERYHKLKSDGQRWRALKSGAR
ncbi:hypothetical protein HanRHA438_Chr17g0829631 [Helianthus annuus]|nr:hypothetical protein HanRHA438_Chr17g0829631 [Helianthus annuus]